MKVKDPMVDIKTVKQTTETDQFESYIMANQMTRCLNVKCGLPIAK